ncbi:MAG: hypothetical protein ACI9YB_003447, partial [Halioglobus sp.]
EGLICLAVAFTWVDVCDLVEWSLNIALSPVFDFFCEIKITGFPIAMFFYF